LHLCTPAVNESAAAWPHYFTQSQPATANISSPATANWPSISPPAPVHGHTHPSSIRSPRIPAPARQLLIFGPTTRPSPAHLWSLAPHHPSFLITAFWPQPQAHSIWPRSPNTEKPLPANSSTLAHIPAAVPVRVSPAEEHCILRPRNSSLAPQFRSCASQPQPNSHSPVEQVRWPQQPSASASAIIPDSRPNLRAPQAHAQTCAAAQAVNLIHWPRIPAPACPPASAL
jgi:hypothetical protein